jgi:hypothetical protein
MSCGGGFTLSVKIACAPTMRQFSREIDHDGRRPGLSCGGPAWRDHEEPDTIEKSADGYGGIVYVGRDVNPAETLTWPVTDLRSFVATGNSVKLGERTE